MFLVVGTNFGPRFNKLFWLLPKNSQPGVYLVNCNCGCRYVGETGGLVKSRICQHQKSIFYERWNDSGLAEHVKNCDQGIDWDNVRLYIKNRCSINVPLKNLSKFNATRQNLTLF